MDDLVKIEKLLKLMQTRGVFRLKVGDIELEMMAATQVDPQVTMDALNAIELDEDDENVAFLHDEKRILQKRLDAQSKREENQDMYGAG